VIANNNNLLEATRSVLSLQDREYFEKLKGYFARCEDTEGVIKVASLLSETVELQKKADDFYNGGIYHLQNGNYERSLADFEEAQRYRYPDASRMIVEVRKQQDKAVLAKQLEEQKRQLLEQVKRQQEQQAADILLKSSVGIDYSKLLDLLKAGKLKELDEEIRRVTNTIAKTLKPY